MAEHDPQAPGPHEEIDREKLDELMERDAKSTRAVTGIWKWIVALLGGAVLLSWPDVTIGVLTRGVGLLLLVAGVITAWSAWRLRGAEGSTVVVTT